MIKLTNLINEETFTATNKDTGKVSVFKSKDSRDAAIKAGTHEKRDEKDSEDKNKSGTSVSGKNMFKHASDIKKQSGDTSDGGGEEKTQSNDNSKYDMSGETDYFEKYDELPDNISKLNKKYFSSDDPDYDYDEINDILIKFQKQGWTFDYGMDGYPYGLKPLGVTPEKMKQLRDADDLSISDTFDNFGVEVGREIEKAVKNDPKYDKYGNPHTHDILRAKYAKKLGYIKESKKFVRENRWLELKNSDESPNQKIGKGIREIRSQLREMEKFVSWYSKIKNENGLNRDKYWKRTNNHLNKIRERLMSLSEKIQKL